MNEVCIGMHVHSDPGRLHASLQAIHEHTVSTVKVVLLPDGADEVMLRALNGLREIPQLPTKEPLGPAACYNRLIKSIAADVYLLLESGSIVGPGWLDHLLAALNADPRNGLVGPSTNRSWNEQCVFPYAGGGPEMIARTAKEAERRFGSTWRSLEPLYSLADFCYGVRREVIESIGAADEAYGLGPCWEMDYNIRAARAGWRGVWAGSAYVYRDAFSERRSQIERLYFRASKHLYQNKFCGLRLAGSKSVYESHCKGEACEHFAPVSGIQISIALEQSMSILASPPVLSEEKSDPPVSFPISDPPLVTCIMPTRNRLDYVLQSIRYFRRQEYPAKELIIVDDGDIDISNTLPHAPDIRVLRSSKKMSIGAKRNWACGEAAGQIIAQWDDDDYYGPRRLNTQVAPLLAGQADITGFSGSLIFDLPQWTFWRLSPSLHKRMFLGDVHGGTLVFWRTLWQKVGHYPDRSLAEDAWFLSKALQLGAHLGRLENRDEFIYIRHRSNSWAFQCGSYVDPKGWQRAPEPALTAEDREFFLQYSAHSSLALHMERSMPLVSAIMPTANRRQFVSKAIEYFRRQTYPNKELIVIDDGTDPVADLIPRDDMIQYLRFPPRLHVGAKRNIGCTNARGEIILHWDDDDWHAPHRISYQVESLLKADLDVCGINNLLFYDQNHGDAWQYSYPSNQKFWLSGSTLCYRKSFWTTHHFPEIDVGEDARFVWSGSRNQMAVLPESTFHVGMIHKHNVSPKQTRGPYWKPYPVEMIQSLLKEDWSLHKPLLALDVSVRKIAMPG